ncbi:MAG: FAD-binding protein [Proteobacteria bacterium]|nr:FAD-binding protein [Pseudomonadota bacterium]MBU1714014.1 FAD-binding protein [Pseudomonadota bacterium]
MDKQTINQLQKIVGPDQLTTTTEELLCYSYDGTAREYLPEAVAFPGSTAEVSAIMRLASQVLLPVVVRGAGSGMTGGALPLKGGLVMAMSRMHKIIEIDTDNHVAVVEPGVITGQFQDEVRRLGLYYPPDPASLKFCTLGGNIAECAGGPSAVKYGVTRDYVLGLEAVLPDGRIINTGVRTAKGVVGYDLTRLLTGSEGTLAIITKIILKLLPMPTNRATFLVVSNSIKQATALVSRILSQHTPCTLEYMDRTALKIVESELPFALPPAAESLLIIEVDGNQETVTSQAKNLHIFLKNEPDLLSVRQAQDEAERAALWSARRAISPSAFKLKPHKISEDVVVPRSKIAELVTFTETLAAEQQTTIFTFGHAGDGNIHVNIMLDKNNSEELARGLIAKKKLFTQVLNLGGTLSGEHGIGITKSEYLAMELDENSLELMKGLKNLFDPLNILNPGKIFPPDQTSQKNI